MNRSKCFSNCLYGSLSCRFASDTYYCGYLFAFEIILWTYTIKLVATRFLRLLSTWVFTGLSKYKKKKKRKTRRNVKYSFNNFHIDYMLEWQYFKYTGLNKIYYYRNWFYMPAFPFLIWILEIIFHYR